MYGITEIWNVTIQQFECSIVTKISNWDSFTLSD